jgi:DNA (cytosine-5)-methyltransferase 1
MVVTHIDLDQREESEEVIFLTEKPTVFPERRRHLSSCTVDGVDGVDDLEVVHHQEIIDLTADPEGLLFLLQDELPLEKIQLLGATVQGGSFLRVRKFLFGKYHVNFVLVKVVLRCQSTDTIKIRGTPFIKGSAAGAKLPRKSNEVCMLIYQDETKRQEFVDIDPSDVLQLYPLIITNALYPNFNRLIFNPRYPEERGRPNRQSTHLTCR